MQSKILSRQISLTVALAGFMLALFTTQFSLSLTTAHAQGLSIFFTKTLQKGATGDEVRELQEFLKKIPDIYPEGLVTGYFGPLTENAVKRFQRKESIEAVGIIGPITRAKLNELITRGTVPAGATGMTNISGTTGIAQETSLVSVTGSTDATSGLPFRLKIPSINVNAPVVYVGLTSDGAMDAPKGPTNVAWFNLGPHPGDNGSAVIAGHFGRWKTGEGSVFDDLSKLNKGDKVYVEDEKGKIATFVVRERRNYDPNADALEVFSSSDGKAHLNLVTCEGVWVPDKKTYTDRLVVFTDKE